MKILAIETSCDETAITVLQGGAGFLKLEKNLLYSQIAIHKKYGGVVPELAARKHAETMLPLLSQAVTKNYLKKIDYLAVTSGPGLITSLLLGLTMAKALAYLNKLPLVGVNHIEGHIYSNWLSHPELLKAKNKYFPALVLVVSGGHTELILMLGHGRYQLIGQTLDDAVGECFDKVAKLLGLGYPGGPIISRLALSGRPQAYDLPRPMINSGDFNFSFSGLKTAVLYSLQKKNRLNQRDIADYAAAFQQAAVEVLVTKTMAAARKYQVKSIMLGGGVAANQSLRQSLQDSSGQIRVPFFSPDLKYTGDNAAMIATAAYYGLVAKKAEVFRGTKVLDIRPHANWQLAINRL